jgi:tetratricopeptide (TPR) repeat protein
MGKSRVCRARFFILGILLTTAISARAVNLSPNRECGHMRPGAIDDLDFANEVLKKLVNEDIEWRIGATPVVFVCRSDDPLAYDYFTPSASDPDRKAVILITTGLMRHAVEGNASRLAAILGHEIGHLALPGGFEDLTVADKSGSSGVATLSKQRTSEIACDEFGLFLALQAGYSYLDGVEAYRKLHDYLVDHGQNVSAFERLGSDHPALADRLARIAPQESAFWLSTSKFESGIALLRMRQYEAAASCFEAVVEKYPGAWEAWANLGYARMFEYADHLDAAELETLGVGQIVEVDSIPRMDPLVPKTDVPNGFDRRDPMEDLETAARLEPGSIVARANLGLAYLLLPSHRDIDKSVALLRSAADAAFAASEFESNTRASILIDLSVALTASHHAEEGVRYLSKADALVDNASHNRDRFLPLKEAVLHNKILRDLNGPDAKTTATLAQAESFLANRLSDSPWWRLVYSRYAQTCFIAGRWPKSADVLSRSKTSDFRPVVGIHAPDGRFLFVGEPAAQFRSDFHIAESPRSSSAVSEISGVLGGVDVITDDYVTAIRLTSSAAPAIQLEARYGESSVYEIRVGMSVRDLDELIDANKGFTILGLKESLDRNLGLAFEFELGKVKSIEILRPYTS